MYNDILPPLSWNKERLEIKYPTISVKDLTNPVFNISTSTGVNDYIAEQIRKAEEQIRKTQDEMIGKVVLSGDYIQPYAIVKLTNEKETKKMEAKKCDRCGKLYEIGNPCDDTSIKVRFKHEFVADKEGMSEQRIIEKQTGKVAIRYDSYSSTDRIDLCPDCIESFKRWFENGLSKTENDRAFG